MESSMIAAITQHDMIWIVLILAVVALVLFILGRR
jgi:hypothetical protein